jgi:hypothetical protein
MELIEEIAMHISGNLDNAVNFPKFLHEIAELLSFAK